MINSMKITRLGDYVKIVSTKLKTNSGIRARENKKEIERDKRKNNLIRAKNKIQDLALANDFTYFFTLTFNTKYDRFNLDVLRLNFRDIVKKLRATGNYDLKYLIVPEQHKNGAWHFHGFLTEDFKNFFYSNDFGFISIMEFERLGFHNIQVIENKARISSYVTKYVSKNLSKGIGRFNHCYFASTGLKTGDVIDEFIYHNTYFDNKFFDYQNDFCYKSIMTSEEFEKCYGNIKILKSTCKVGFI